MNLQPWEIGLCKLMSNRAELSRINVQLHEAGK